jgi:DNA-binding NarL/FixJ family response regulator
VSYTVLIVDDNAVVRHLVRSCVEQDSDWKICGEAENGEIAIEKVKTLHPDIVILDFQMPVMNGLEAARHINQIAPATAMVLLTAHNREMVSHAAQDAGIRLILSKDGGISKHLLPSLKNVAPSRLSE